MILRPATDADEAYFFELRNDATAIAHSWSKRAVTALEHSQWWRNTPDERYVAVGIKEGDVGVVRLTQLDESTCEVHLAVAPECRGRGYATEMLREATRVASERGYKRIVARVDADNTPSMRAFLRAGYDVISPGTLLLEREV